RPGRASVLSQAREAASPGATAAVILAGQHPYAPFWNPTGSLTSSRASGTPAPEGHRQSEPNSFPGYNVHTVVNTVHNHTRPDTEAAMAPQQPADADTRSLW